jgi:hypothetical protein
MKANSYYQLYIDCILGIDRGSSPIEIDVAKEEQQHPIAAVKSQFAEETDPSSVHPLPLPSMTNTDEKEEMAAIQMDLPFIALEIGQQKQKSGHVVAAETQTDAEWLNDQIKQMAAEEKALKRRSVDKVTETDDTGGPVNTMMQDEFIMITCGGGYDRSSLEIDEEIYEKIIATNPELVEEKGSVKTIKILGQF